jgi:hypothetical protein
MISLHADHVDASGAYGQKFAVVQELANSGLLAEIPEEFRDTQSPIQETVIVATEQKPIQDEFDMTNGHADHVDETGRYARAYEAKYGQGSLGNQVQQEESQVGNSWKSFLQKIIAEEKSKLKV